MLLPTFEVGGERALRGAEAAANAGLDGVFAYDHLWPMGSPTRPSLAPFPMLAAVAGRIDTLIVATLVARVGLVDTAHLVEEFETLALVAPGRVIAAIGTGDHLSVAENDAFGLARTSASERRALLASTATALRDSMPVWVGAGATATNEVARSLGVTINLWNAAPEKVANFATDGPVSWAGSVPDDVGATLDALREAGASWAVLTPNADVGVLGEWRRAN